MRRLFQLVALLIILIQSILEAFLSRPELARIRPRIIQRFKEDDSAQLSDYPEFVTDEDFVRSESTWWQIFANGKSASVPAAKEPQIESWLPDVGAWRNVFVEETVVKEESPPTLQEYFGGIKPLGPEHEQNIQGLWSQMKNRRSLKVLCSADKLRLLEALRVAYVSLWGKHTKRSLEISINRARGTAAVLGELEADVEVVLSAILSDVLLELQSNENPSLLRRELSKRFGKDVLALSEKYNKLPVFMSMEADYTQLQSENQIQMLVAVSEEYRALYIRLADRLHTMRTLRSLPLDVKERLKIAEEALNVYAPLAHRMGVMKVKGELEDLAFKILHPEMFQKTKYTQIAANKAYHEAMEAVQLIMTNSSYLTEQGVRSVLSFRIKDKYQLFLKMQRKNLSSVSQVRDALGMRIIAVYPRRDSETDENYIERGNSICYHLVSELRNVTGWVPSERGFKDYIKKTKENGYQSLHQYIKNKALGTNVEIQVRTRAMHLKAELGEAAHWFYKDQTYKSDIVERKIYKQVWRSPQQTAARSPAELIGMAKKQLLSSRVLVFLEDRSTVLNMKKGHTALDAAFALHSDVGLTLTGVKVGGKTVGLDYTLQNGDIVSCESCADTVSVKPAWIGICKSSSAQAKIRKYFRDNNRAMLVCIGLMHMLMSLTLSEDCVKARYPNGLPTVTKLAEYATKRTPFSITNIAEFLERLAGTSKSESAGLLGSLLDIPASKLTVASMRLGLIWANMEDKNGWEDKQMQKRLLIPLLQDVLPALGLPQIENKWIELIGSRSLIVEEESRGLMPFKDLFTTKLGPAGKKYNYIFPSVIQAPQHAMISPRLFPESYATRKPVSVAIDKTALLERVRQYKALNNKPVISLTPATTPAPEAASVNPVSREEISGITIAAPCLPDFMFETDVSRNAILEDFSIGV